MDTTSNGSTKLSDVFVDLLGRAFAELLGPAAVGAVAFCRCLKADVVSNLAADAKFNLSEWQIQAVTERDNPADRQISSDHAVELREDKGPAVLLLVDTERAGAGMDGIYSAARELTEDMLFDCCRSLSKHRMGMPMFAFAEAALKRARQVGQGKAISRWQEFEFLARASSKKESVGQCLAAIGLWPIAQSNGIPNLDDLHLSSRLVERLLLGVGEERTPASRVRSLLLVDPTSREIEDLENIVRIAMNQPVVFVLRDIEKKPHLWINAINPGFHSQELQQIKLKPWRLSTGKLAKWSGLTVGTPLPSFLLRPGDVPTAKQPKLEIRFETLPADLPKGSVEYRISVRSSDDELAYREVSHQEKPIQTVCLTNEDFQDLPEDSQFEAQVHVEALGANVTDALSEEFLIRFEDSDTDVSPSSNARRHRSLVEGAIEIPNVDDFDVDCQNTACFFVDNKGYVGFRPTTARASFKAHRPPLIALIEQLLNETTAIGRWSVRVRADGTRVGPPQFHECAPDGCQEATWEKLTKASQRLKEESASYGGYWGRIYTGSLKAAEEYVNAWGSVLDEGAPHCALANTIEVQALSGKPLGLVVLPSHPVRVAWHMAFDQLARHARYEQGMRPSDVRKALETIDAANIPAALPGFTDESAFVFADTIGFYGVAMVLDQDPEPKAAVAQMMACLGNGDGELHASIGLKASDCVAREVYRYVDFHREQIESSGLIRLHAIRPGDGSTVTRALGDVLKHVKTDDEDSSKRLRFHLELFPADPHSCDVTGSHLRNIAVRHQTGATGILNDDRWTLQSETYPGNLLYPKLHWAQRDARLPSTPAHVTVAFDTFETVLSYVPEQQLATPTPLHVYGLTAATQRSFRFQPEVRWESWHPPVTEGIKHPAGRVLSERLTRVHRAALKAVVRNAGRPGDHWPVLCTTLLPDQQEDLYRVHALSDWVVTVDRNAGVEFFDSPRDARGIFEAYVIDCVPERTDLGSLQMITSTTKTDEVRDLLDAILGAMGLSGSLKNCTFLIEQLKGLSGRLAMRLTTTGSRSGELIALAMVYANCVVATASDQAWLSLSDGFFVPVDDVPDLAPGETTEEVDGPGAVRADLIYVSCVPRSGLTFTFVEVKYRRHLRMARDNQLLDDIAVQAENHHRRWHEWYFGSNVPELSLVVRRSRLVRALRFYADKAARHSLTPQRHELLVRELDKLMSQGGGYRLAEPADPSRGYVFSPEMGSALPEKLLGVGIATAIYLCGPSQLPDLIAGMERSRAVETAQETTPSMEKADRSAITPKGDSTDPSGSLVAESAARAPEGHPTIEGSSAPDASLPSSASILLGTDKVTKETVIWTVTSRANPHLMVVGLPGMGKTESLLNICRELIAQSIVPIVFSYHPDIDARLISAVSGVRLLDHQELGFNPMHIDTPTPHAHIDSSGMLRDIFSALFSDLGDVQLERIRQAIKQSYVKLGWGQTNEGTAGSPEFRSFYSLLQQEQKPDKNLLARLNELDDYGVFRTDGCIRSLLNTDQPSIIRIHATQNEMVQRATAMFSLYNIYKEMFRRGVQPRITHAIIFDEAHRASRLRLLPTFAAECRKFGLSLILASQSSRDFDTSLFSGIASYLLLRMTEQDAMSLSRNITTSDQSRRVADRLKQLEKYHALFFREGHRQPAFVSLSPPAS